MYHLFLKRIIDLLVSLTLLILLFPVILTLTAILLIANNGKPFFSQDRPGKNEKIFRLFKFKTMKDETNAKLGYDQMRVTKVGAILRKYSLDELPQLINVLIGDMSLIGPRPLMIRYLPLYNNNQKRRHQVRPGITGWAQVNGRNTIKWTKKFEYDIWYIDNMSFMLDLKIVFLTIKKVFKREGVNYDDTMSMTPFTGSPDD